MLGGILSVVFLALVANAIIFVCAACLSRLEQRVTRGWPTTEATIVGYKLQSTCAEGSSD